MRVMVTLVLVGAIGCGATYPVPRDQYAAAQIDVGRAEQAASSGAPDARLHSQLAQENLAMANRLMGDQNDRAASLIARARAEAALAVDLAAQAKALAQAQTAADAVVKARASANPAQ